ncbi:hypothetical protein [Streptomyces scabiei]|uniref:hypothetical protein n=1 Tax=Streptomyces scabiei TaxID=1930 RepID=UPI002FEE722E
MWKRSPFAPYGTGADALIARAGPTSHAVAGPPETGTAQTVPIWLSATYKVRPAGSMARPLGTPPTGNAAMRWGVPPGGSFHTPLREASEDHTL